MSKTFPFKHDTYQSHNDMPSGIQPLMQKAEEQLDYAYAPYSQFYVGAALLIDNGEIYTGCNQENASYPLCICAERVALYNVGTTHKSFKIIALAITAYNPKKELREPCMPCGACRQVIQEFEHRQKAPIPLYLASKGHYAIGLEGISDLLPVGFSIDSLL